MTFGMPLTVTPLYLAVFAVFGTVLAAMAGRIRGSERISIGDGGRADLLLAIRRHGNFVEYVPYFMLMLAVLELNGTSDAWLHGLGTAMIGARVCHAIGLKADTVESPFRVVGAGGTLLLMLVAAWLLAAQFLRS